VCRLKKILLSKKKRKKKEPFRRNEPKKKPQKKEKDKKNKKMEKRGARAVVVSGAIAVFIAGLVFWFMKWRFSSVAPVTEDTGTGSGSWLASLGIGAEPQTQQTQAPYQTQAPHQTHAPHAQATQAPQQTKPPVVPIQRIEIGELPSIFPEDEFGVPITDSQFSTPARAKGFDDTAQALKDGAFSDERVMPTLSTKNGGMLSTLDVRGDYAAPVLFDPNDRTCGSCDKQCVLDGKWNQSSAQRNIDLGIIREERRRRIVFADE
jgi:hypothetical protein